MSSVENRKEKSESKLRSKIIGCLFCPGKNGEMDRSWDASQYYEYQQHIQEYHPNQCVPALAGKTRISETKKFSEVLREYEKATEKWERQAAKTNLTSEFRNDSSPVKGGESALTKIIVIDLEEGGATEESTQSGLGNRKTERPSEKKCAENLELKLEEELGRSAGIDKLSPLKIILKKGSDGNYHEEGQNIFEMMGTTPSESVTEQPKTRLKKVNDGLKVRGKELTKGKKEPRKTRSKPHPSEIKPNVSPHVPVGPLVRLGSGTEKRKPVEWTVAKSVQQSSTTGSNVNFTFKLQNPEQQSEPQVLDTGWTTDDRPNYCANLPTDSAVQEIAEKKMAQLTEREDSVTEQNGQQGKPKIRQDFKGYRIPKKRKLEESVSVSAETNGELDGEPAKSQKMEVEKEENILATTDPVKAISTISLPEVAEYEIRMKPCPDLIEIGNSVSVEELLDKMEEEKKKMKEAFLLLNESDESNRLVIDETAGDDKELKTEMGKPHQDLSKEWQKRLEGRKLMLKHPQLIEEEKKKEQNERKLRNSMSEPEDSLTKKNSDDEVVYQGLTPVSGEVPVTEVKYYVPKDELKKQGREKVDGGDEKKNLKGGSYRKVQSNEQNFLSGEKAERKEWGNGENLVKKREDEDLRWGKKNLRRKDKLSLISGKRNGEIQELEDGEVVEEMTKDEDLRWKKKKPRRPEVNAKKGERKQTEGKKMVCLRCKDRFGSPKEIAKHELRNHKELTDRFIFTCGICCADVSYTETSYFSHMLQHNDPHAPPIFSCHRCHLKTTGVAQMAGHMIKAHKELPGLVLCERCWRIYPTWYKARLCFHTHKH